MPVESVDSGSAHSFRASTALEQNDRDPEIARAVVRAQAGDMEAIRFLYLRYKNNVYGYVLSILRDQHEAEDVTQHVFMKLISVIPKYEPRQVPFTSWILRVARNRNEAVVARRGDVRTVPDDGVRHCEHVAHRHGGNNGRVDLVPHIRRYERRGR